jgi:DNA-binding LacI/PurR family transcriptional regulator
VATDHAGAVAEAVGWLADRGHTRIAFEAGPTTLLVNRHRLEGYRSALAARRLAVDPPMPTALLRTWARHRESPAPPGAEVVLLDAFPDTPASGAWIEAPSALVGERAARVLDQRIAGASPSPELHPARFHPAYPIPERSFP